MTDASGPPSIDGYRVLGPLGRGSMGTVWRAVDRSGREVAVKLPDRAVRVPATQRDEMFRREALVALNLRHPNLVRGLEIGTTDDGRTFLAMELVEGETLGHVMRTLGPLGEGDLLAVGLALAGALEHAHARGLLHRDVKPENVMRLADGSWKLIDLSLVSERGYGELGCGSPGYASPEMIRKQPVGPASDLFAVAATLAAAALGRTYFAGRDVKEVLRATLRTPIELPTHVNGEPLSTGLRAVVARLGRADPADRYASAAELRLDLEAIAHGQRPLGAYLGRLPEPRAPVPRGTRGTRVRVVAPAALVLLVGTVALLVGRAVPRETSAPRPAVPPVAARPEPAPSAGDPGDAEVGAVVLYVQAHPDDAARGRALIAARLAAAPTTAQRARLDEASAILAAHERRRAEALLAAQTERARGLLDAGDVAGIARAFADWPADLAGTAPAAEARARSAAWRAQALEAGAALLARATGLLARPATDASAGADLRELGTAIDAFLASPARDADQRAALAASRARLVEREQALGRASRAAVARAMLTTAFASAPESGAVRDTLGRVASEGGFDRGLTVAASAVLAAAHAVERELADRLRPTRDRACATIAGGRVLIGVPSASTSPAELFGPTPEWGLPSGLPATALLDLTAAVPDPEAAGAWLLFHGFVEAAEATAPPDSPTRLLVAVAPPRPKAPERVLEGIWSELARRVPLTIRPVGKARPVAPASDEPLLRAWAAAVASPARRSAVSAAPPGLSSARSAFLVDDLSTAWRLLEEAVVQAPDHPEVALLRAGVLHAAGASRPSGAVAFLAFSEARRAWELDGMLPAGPRLVADTGLRLAGRFRGDLARAIKGVLLVACEDALERGQGTPPIAIHVAAARLEEGRPRDALTVLRRAVREVPGDGELWAWIGRAEADAGDTPQAIEALRSARRILGLAFPDWARVLADELARR
ncbi:MAG: protein kinase [Planctomycetota bacterium]